MHYFGALLQKGTDSAYLFHTKIVPQGHCYSTPLQDSTIFDPFFFQQKQCPLFKGTIIDLFLPQKQGPFFPRGHNFQPFIGKWCPKGTVLENYALLVGSTFPKGNCFGAFLLKKAPFFKTVSKGHCFGSVFFHSVGNAELVTTLGGGSLPLGSSTATHARMDRVLFLQLLILQRVSVCMFGKVK